MQVVHILEVYISQVLTLDNPEGMYLEIAQTLKKITGKEFYASSGIFEYPIASKTQPSKSIALFIKFLL